MTAPNLPSVIACPACGRTQGAPSHGRAFDCMFCGETIQPANLSAPAPSFQEFVQSAIGGELPPTIGRPIPQRTPAVRSRPASFAFDPGAAEIAVYRWWNPLEAAGALLGLIYTAAIVLIVLQPMLRDGATPSVVAILALALVAFSLVNTLYRALAFLINRTTLRVLDDGEGKDILTVQHGPLPWTGSGARIPRAELTRVVVGMRGGRRSARRMALVAERRSGAPVTLIPAIRSANDARELAHTLNFRLNLDPGPTE